MSYRYAVLLAAFVLPAVMSTARAQGDESRGKSVVYLRSPDERLARLSSSLSLGSKRETKARRILVGVDADVRRAIAAGNAKIRLLLNEEEREVFDGLRDDTEGGPQSVRPTRHLKPMQSLDSGGGGRGAMGGGMMGGAMGQGGAESGSETRGGSLPQGGGQRGYCGDGICDQLETSRGICPKDCSQSQEEPAQE